METVYHLDKIGTALAKAQSEMAPVIKDAKNPHFRSSYATLASVIEAIRDPLTKHGISFVQLPGALDDAGLHLTTVLIHSSGQTITSDMVMPLVKRDPQSLGSALTYARRYALMSVLGLPAEDDDAEAAHSRDTKPAPAPVNVPKRVEVPKETRTLAALLGEAVDAAIEHDSLIVWREENADKIARLPDEWQARLRQKIAGKLAELSRDAA